MAAAPSGEQVNAIVKLLSEKSVADVQQGAKLLRHFVKDHGSSARNELLQWGVVHSVMTLLTEVSTICLLALCSNSYSLQVSSVPHRIEGSRCVEILCSNYNSRPLSNELYVEPAIQLQLLEHGALASLVGL
jgi:hypothetical protein